MDTKTAHIERYLRATIPDDDTREQFVKFISDAYHGRPFGKYCSLLISKDVDRCTGASYLIDILRKLFLETNSEDWYGEVKCKYLTFERQTPCFVPLSDDARLVYVDLSEPIKFEKIYIVKDTRLILFGSHEIMNETSRTLEIPMNNIVEPNVKFNDYFKRVLTIELYTLINQVE